MIRQPCEVCGERGQAHHDSYHPDRWLDVRWLCGKHHMRWHAENAAHYPTIFEFHPCDVPRNGGGGQTNRPWFRAQTKSWYVKINGKAISLGRDRDEAVRRFEEMKAKKKSLLSSEFAGELTV